MDLRRAPLALLLWGAAPVAWADESLGVNVHDGAPEHIAAAAALGVRWVRLDGNWIDQEPARDQYVWTLDGAVSAARQANLEVFITLAYTPAWVARRGDTDGVPNNDVPASADWADFVGAAVAHYRAAGVRHFGMWNEANLRGFFEGTPADYVNVIAVPGAAAVRAACADCRVLGPELAHVGDADDVLEEVLRVAPRGTFDIITHHSYNGFSETGWNVFDGDGFINVLDRQRFPFARRSLRQVLDGAGYQGDVWITETGYRAGPGNGTEEQRQATYVRRVMEEQLLRVWYTNTFFYEIHDCGVDQPGCTIDGFGLMRATGGVPGSRAFPAQFRLKPAFAAIQAFIQANPSIVGTQPPLQCGDGVDNDGDGRIDLADRGCAGAADDLESDDPPRAQVEARALSGAVTVDGDLGELAGAAWLTLGASAWQGTEPLGARDHQVRLAVGWDSNGFLVGAEVVDDVHANDHPPAELWQGDALQLAFDVGQSGGSGYDAVDDHELNFALTPAGTRTFRFHGPAGASDAFTAAVVRAGDVTRYEVRLPRSALPGVAWRAGARVGFSFLVDEDDGAGRVGWSEWTSGIGVTKEPERFGEIALVGAGAADAGVPGDAAPAEAGVDAASSGDAGAAPSEDASAAPMDASASATDAAVRDAAGADAGRAADAGGVVSPAPDDGCSCASGPAGRGDAGAGGAGRAAALLGAVALWLRGRGRYGARTKPVIT